MTRRRIVVGLLVLAGFVWLIGLTWNWLHSPAATAADEGDAAVEMTGGAEVQDVPTPTDEPSQTVMPSESSPAPTSANWADRRDEILQSSAAPAEKASSLLVLLPDLAAPDQEEAARHLTNFLEDDEFVTAGAYLTNAEAPEVVQSVLMADLLNRPEHLKLPFFLIIARTPEHRHASEAQALLALHFAEDFGTNWTAWEAAVQTRLQNHP